jgi:HPt (histidine-containing phosphotransfer) domain-containing protein
MEKSINVKTQKGWIFLNLDYLEKISSGEIGFFSESMKGFKTESSVFVKRMRKDFLMNDYKNLSRTAHSMKPISRYIGINHLSDLIETLEEVAATESREQINLLLSEIEKVVSGAIGEIDEYNNHRPVL